MLGVGEGEKKIGRGKLCTYTGGAGGPGCYMVSSCGGKT